jgi:hypothetical protein
MKIFVQARKDGYNTLYPSQTPNEFRQFASDIILIRNEPKNVHGKSVYSIAFGNDGYIFTQHIIVEDIQRAGLGNVGFSIFISKDYKLSGDNIKNLLDELIKSYCKSYCNDFYLSNVQEDWILFTSLANSYDSKLVSVSSEDNETKQSGNLDAAFIYFTSDLELQKYFEQPNQEEYIPYRQIFFISNEFKGKPNPENPLYVLKNSGVDLTGIIDLENPPYKLREFHGNAKNGVSITIKNSKGRQLYNKDKIFRKDELTVVYSKKNYKEKRITGSLLNSEEIRNYLNVSNDNKIDVLKEVELESEVKTISFEVVKKDGSRVTDAVITYKNNYQPEKQVLNNQVTFSGEDLNERWTVSAINGEYKGQIIIIPDEVDNEIKKIQLIRKKDVKLKVLSENGDIVHNYKVYCQSHRDSNKLLSEIEFIDDEIDKTWNIHIYGNSDYQDSESRKFCPETDGIEIIFHLKEKTIKTPNNGKKTISDGNDYNDQKEEIPFFKKPKFIILSIVSVLILSIGIWGLRQTIFKPKPNEKLFSLEQISNYLESDELILDTLKLYKANWEMQNPQNNTNDEGFWSSIFHNDENQNSSEEIDNWNQISDSIVSAITKRELIDKKDFEKLREVHFNNQESFEKTIHNLSKNKYELLKKKLGDISSLSLSEIESKIDSILDKQDINKGSTNLPPNQEPKTTSKVTDPPQSTGGITTGSAGKKEKKGPDKAGKNTNGTSVNSSSDISSEIKNYLKGDEIKKIKLEEYKNTVTDPKIKGSIIIVLKLWELDGKDSKKKKDYLKQIENNSYLTNSKLKQFIERIINKNEPIKKNNMKTLKEIIDENN